MTAGWISHDEGTKLGVMEMELPRGISLRQKSLEEGFAKQMQGRITRSDVRNDGGHTIYIMSAQGTMLGIQVAATQSVVAVGSKGYKAMAFVLGDDARRQTRQDSLSSRSRCFGLSSQQTRRRQ